MLNSRLHRQVGRRIAKLALERCLSMNHLADFAGLSRSYVSAILRGRKSPTLRTLEKLADALDVDVRDLFPDR